VVFPTLAATRIDGRVLRIDKQPSHLHRDPLLALVAKAGKTLNRSDYLTATF
jgi:hypothetical protein